MPGKDQAALTKARNDFFADKTFKVPKLNLDAKMVELQKQYADAPKKEKTEDNMTPSEGLAVLCERINASKSTSAKHFWDLLGKAEDHGRKHFKKFPVTVAQMKTKHKHISAVTLQVQLCEFRQFGNYKG